MRIHPEKLKIAVEVLELIKADTEKNEPYAINSIRTLEEAIDIVQGEGV